MPVKRSFARPSRTRTSPTPRELVVIGSSLGGLHALHVVLDAIPAGYQLPVLVAQHRQAGQVDILSAHLLDHCAVPVTEAEDKTLLLAGHVYLAPAGYHLLVERGNLALSLEAPVNWAQPSVDVLFESAAYSYGAGVVGVILTGMGSDGAAGLAAIRECGGIAVVQDPETAEERGMPEAAIAMGAVDLTLPLLEIGRFLAEVGNTSKR